LARWYLVTSKQVAEAAWKHEHPDGSLLRLEGWPIAPHDNTWLPVGQPFEDLRHAVKLMSFLDDGNVEFAPATGGVCQIDTWENFRRAYVQTYNEEEEEEALCLSL
jgi:hypothetical protein